MSHERPLDSLNQANSAQDRETPYQEHPYAGSAGRPLPTRTGSEVTSAMLAAPIRPQLHSMSLNNRQSLPGLHDLNLLSPSSKKHRALHVRDHDSQQLRNNSLPPPVCNSIPNLLNQKDPQLNGYGVSAHQRRHHESVGSISRYGQGNTALAPPATSPYAPAHLPRPSSAHPLRSPAANEQYGRPFGEPQHSRSSTTNILPPQPDLISPASSMSMPSSLSLPPHSIGHRRDGSDGGYFGINRPPAPVEQVLLPGKGWVYRYNDGSLVPCVVDGQPVNPHHGITKQGHPRKRGSHACLSCRSKKVKCEADSANPDGPCKACARSGHDCQWTVSSHDRSSPDGASDPGTPAADKRRRYTSSDEIPDRMSMSGHGLDALALHERPSQSFKRPRTDHCDFNPRATAEHGYKQREPASMNVGFHHSVDPSQLNRLVTKQLLDLYFDHRDCHCTHVLPRYAFVDWALRSLGKQQKDLMSIYACMALGSVFATTTDLKAAGAEAVYVAKQLEGAQAGNFSLELALTRLHLALYCFAKGESGQAFEYTATACRTLCCLGYNTEVGCQAEFSDQRERNEFHLPSIQVIECRRRALWLGFAIERTITPIPTTPTILQPEKIFLRVPCKNEAYTNAVSMFSPFYDSGTFNLSHPGCGDSAAFISILSIHNDICVSIYRDIHRQPSREYVTEHEHWHAQSTARLERWEIALKPHQRFSPGNTYTALRSSAGFTPYYVLHSVYMAALLTLNRYFRHDRLPAATSAKYLSTAHAAAKRWLEFITTVAKEADHQSQLAQQQSQQHQHQQQQQYQHHYQTQYQNQQDNASYGGDHYTNKVPTSLSPDTTTILPPLLGRISPAPPQSQTSQPQPALTSPAAPPIQPTQPLTLTPLTPALTNPLPAPTTHLASDILSRGGPSHTLSSVTGALVHACAVLEKHGRCFEGVPGMKKAVYERMVCLGGWKMMCWGGRSGECGGAVGSAGVEGVGSGVDGVRGSHEGEAEWRLDWKAEGPIGGIVCNGNGNGNGKEEPVPKEMDAVYGVEEGVFARAVFGFGGS